MIITVEILNNFYACDNGVKGFEKHFPNGLDISGLWGRKSERQKTWLFILTHPYLKTQVGWAIMGGLLPAKIWADLSGIDLSGANLAGANLYRVDLTGANLSEANLVGVDFSEADLTEANLTGADLSCANMYETDLYKADLTGANLKGVDLDKAYLAGAIGL
jgi:uncharacterized protein YjbI with pentapeptide repeats